VAGVAHLRWPASRDVGFVAMWPDFDVARECGRLRPRAVAG
jgi:hypothetical protein